jgi:hypothetical protein
MVLQTMVEAGGVLVNEPCRKQDGASPALRCRTDCALEQCLYARAIGAQDRRRAMAHVRLLCGCRCERVERSGGLLSRGAIIPGTN